MQGSGGRSCAGCGAPLADAQRFCIRCGAPVQGRGTAGGTPSPGERLLYSHSVIMYRGWLNSLRQSVPFAGSPGVLTLTDRRLVFIKGLLGRAFEDLSQLDARLAQRNGLVVAVNQVLETASGRGSSAVVSVSGIPLAGEELQLSVRVQGPAEQEAFTFAIQPRDPNGEGLEAWLSLVQSLREGRRGRGHS